MKTPLYPTVILLFIWLTGCSQLTPQTNDAVPTIGSGPVAIDVPSTLMVLSVNGQQVDAPNLYDGFYQLKVPAGSQRIVVKYLANWNTSEESGYLIEWPPVAIDYQFRIGQRYQLTHPTVSNRDQAMALRDSAPVTLQAGNEEISGKAVVTQKESVRYLLADEANSTGITRLEQLQDLWNASSEQEQAEFRQWLRAQ